MDNSEIISTIAIVLAAVSLTYSIFIHRKNTRINDAIFHMERNVHFEGRMSEWEDAFEFYGINLIEANNEKVSKDEELIYSKIYNKYKL